MAETSHRQTGSPSEDPSSPIITESQTPTSTDQPSADNKPSQEQSNIDSRVIDMEQDRNVAPLEEHSGGGFDPNGHYQDGEFHLFWFNDFSSLYYMSSYFLYTMISSSNFSTNIAKTIFGHPFDPIIVYLLHLICLEALVVLTNLSSGHLIVIRTTL